MKYMQPLLPNYKKDKDQKLNNINIIKEEQNIICRLLYIINSQDPELIFEIFNQFKNIFSYGGQICIKYSLPSLVNSIIIFTHKLIICYENKTSQLPKELNISEKSLKEIINSINIDEMTNEIFIKLITNLFKLYIYCASLINNIFIEREKFNELCLSFINEALNLLELNPKLNKANLIQYLSSYLINFNILTDEQKNKLMNIFNKIDEEMQNREQQFKLILIISKLYYYFFKDSKNVLECLIKARRYADFEMTISKNISLYIDLINIMIFFVEKDNDIIEIKKEQIEDLIELIKGHINTIKEDKNEIIEVEKYFENILNTLKKRKNHKNEKIKEFYQKISV